MSVLRNFAPQAVEELERAVEWHADGHGGTEIAEGLLAAALEAADLLIKRPFLGRRRPELLSDPYRFWSLTRFPNLMVYNPNPYTRADSPGAAHREGPPQSAGRL